MFENAFDNTAVSQLPDEMEYERKDEAALEDCEYLPLVEKKGRTRRSQSPAIAPALLAYMPSMAIACNCSATAPALLYLLHPCSRPALQAYMPSMAISLR